MAPDPDPTHGLTDEQLADLARLADGTLPAERRAEVEARVAASPQLSRLVERQAIAVEALRGTADTGAPARLRADVGRLRSRSGGAGRRLRTFAVRGAVAAAATVAFALALVLPGAWGDGPSVASAAALAQKRPTQAAPAAVAGTPLLRAEVDDVPFPNYDAKFGWKPVGARQDDPSERDATTVYYEKAARTIAYTIVSGDSLDPPEDARSTTRGGVEYRSFRDGGRTVVTWERGGHTCVLSGDEVPAAELVTLADWRGQGSIPF
jgi:anti-sigma factor RsiW